MRQQNDQKLPIEVIVNRMLECFNLQTKNGMLHLIVPMKYGKATKVIGKAEEGLKFLGLTENYSIEEVVSSKYFSSRMFFNDRGIPSLVAVKKYCRENNIKNKFNYRHGKTYIKLIESNFNMRFSAQPNISYANERELRNKFNGKLVMRWANITEGKLLNDTMNEFKNHIENTKNTTFYEYILQTTPAQVRDDFKTHYNVFENIILK